MAKCIALFTCLLQSILMSGQAAFKIEGKIDAEFPQKIQIQYLDKTDTVISKDGNFSFKGELDHPVLVTLSSTNILPNKTVSKDIFVEKGLVTIHSTFAKLTTTIPYLEHNSSQKILDNYNSRFTLLVDMWRFTNDSLIKKPDATDEDKRIAQKLAQKIYSFEELYDKDFITQNTSNYVGAYFFYRYGANYMEEKEIDSVYNLFSQNLKSSFYLKSVEEKIKYLNLLKEGMSFPTIVLKDLKQNDIATTKIFTSRLTLIDLWATWCKPCIESHTLLKKLYSKYKVEGFDIIGISVDDNKENWIKYLKKETLTWKNFIDPKGAKGEINKIFSLESDNGIPFFVFVNENGEYIEINVETEQLETFIKNYLKI